MSVRINLLPQEATDRQRATRQRAVLLSAVGLLVITLGATTVWQNGRIDDADARLANERAILAGLQAEVDQLAEFADLERRVTESETLLVEALASESSVAGILQDVSAVMPDDTELESLTITTAMPDTAATGAAVDPTLDPTAGSFGTLTAIGRSENAHVGVERLLREFDKVAAFHDVFLAGSALDDPEEPYPVFTVEAELGPEVLTGRYTNGLPEALR